jgi:hypothetical protein
MKRLCTLGTVCALGMALSGCIQSPTAADGSGHTVGSGNLNPTTRSISAEAGGYTYGSGNRTLMSGAPSDASGTTTTTSSAVAPPDTGTVVGRGGHTFGSGN